MKALFTSVFVLGMIFLANASANPDTLVKKESLMANTMVEATDKHVAVTLGAPVGKVKIYILNEDDKILAVNKYRANQALKIPYNLDDLPEGAYKIKIKTKDEEITYEVLTEEKKVVMDMPIVAYGRAKDQHTINLKVLGIKVPGTQVDIFDESNKRIASDEVNVEEGFERNYRFTNRDVEGLYVRIKDAQGRKKYIYF
ncbi:hypothetical protein [Echinicola vietnamensis]|uniref:Uncharacterized protein n=1 Tax=Echinicola vietnamensis (strain DSM 17526 / LMG 23754 / KMM 6221) TaxID=926556 RepID=L0FXG6_ECHVK|nr:hypothetical protein [Echinicola vietnamensis]AGA77987.1 hypothetical protein Echvi_1722 [Echinicola vietnamensis DSM 17526]